MEQEQRLQPLMWRTQHRERESRGKEKRGAWEKVKAREGKDLEIWKEIGEKWIGGGKRGLDVKPLIGASERD